MVEEVSHLELLDSREVSPGKYLMRMRGTLDCEFEAIVHKSESFDLEGLRIYQFDWNNHYVMGGVSRQLKCEIDLTVNFTEDVYSELSILSIEITEPQYE